LSIASASNNAATTGMPVLRAGTDAFTVTATTNGVAGYASGYTGTLTVNGSAIQAISPATTAGTITTATAFPAATVGTPSSTASGTFRYGDVGAIGLQGTSATTLSGSTILSSYAPFVYDNTWTSVDSVSTQNDCNAGTNAASFSNTIDSNGKYGCNFGNAAGIIVGRFRPDHYALVNSTVTPAITGASPVSPTNPYFTYMGQPIPVIAYQLEACAGTAPACSATKNYDASIGYPVVQPVMVAEDMATANQGYNLISRLALGTTVPASPNWSQGLYTMSAASPSTAVFSIPSTQPGGLTAASVAKAGGPFDLLELGVNMTDADGGIIYNNDMNATVAGTCSGTGCNAKQIGSTTSVREGRLVLANGYGSQNLTLPVLVSAQYYNSTNSAWLLNTADSGTGATTIPAGGAILNNAIAAPGAAAAPSVAFVASQGSTTALAASPARSLTNGQLTYYLYDTNAYAGTVDMAIDLGPSATDVSCLTNGTGVAGNMLWLRYLWCSSTLHDPSARMKFGSAKTPYIYLREMY
jgi:MSHA biogenesis protein MshQ